MSHPKYIIDRLTQPPTRIGTAKTITEAKKIIRGGGLFVPYVIYALTKNGYVTEGKYINDISFEKGKGITKKIK